MLFKKVFFEIISTQFLLQFSKLFPNLSFFIKILFLETNYFSFTLYDVWS